MSGKGGSAIGLLMAASAMVVGCGLIMDTWYERNKKVFDDRISKLETRAYLLEKKVEQLTVENEMIDRRFKMLEVGKSPVKPSIRLASGRSVSIPEGMKKCEECKGKGCAVVNIGGAMLNLVQEKCEVCDGRGFVEEGK